MKRSSAMINVKDIRLTPEELDQCIDFARRSAPTQQKIEFGSHDTKPRDPKEVARDNLIGKIAEVAFSKMMKANYGLDIPLYFEIYPRGKWDQQDALIHGWRIDVKGTRKGGRWMLVEWNKLNFRQREDRLSHVYVMFSVDWDRAADQPTGRASYEGAASLNKLRADCQTTRVLRKGEPIPGTHAILQADNYGILFRDLYKHLNHLVKYLQENEPPHSLTENYPNPFTGQTTKQILAAINKPDKPAPAREAEAEVKAEAKPVVAEGLVARIKKLFGFNK